MIIKLPLSSDPSQVFTIQLDTFHGQIEVQYNDRSGVWAMSIADVATGVVLVESVPLLLGVDVLEPYNFNIGRLIAVDETSQGVDAKSDSLGSSINAYWFSADEVLP